MSWEVCVCWFVHFFVTDQPSIQPCPLLPTHCYTAALFISHYSITHTHTLKLPTDALSPTRACCSLPQSTLMRYYSPSPTILWLSPLVDGMGNDNTHTHTKASHNRPCDGSTVLRRKTGYLPIAKPFFLYHSVESCHGDIMSTWEFRIYIVRTFVRFKHREAYGLFPLLTSQMMLMLKQPDVLASFACN